MVELRAYKVLIDKELSQIYGGLEKDIGTNILNIRTKKGLKRKKLSELLNISVSTLYRYETGSRVPNLDTIIEMSIILDTDIKNLIYKSGSF